MAGKHGERVETIVPCLSDESQEKLHSDCYWLFCVLKMPQNPIHPSIHLLSALMISVVSVQHLLVRLNFTVSSDIKYSGLRHYSCDIVWHVYLQSVTVVTIDPAAQF